MTCKRRPCCLPLAARLICFASFACTCIRSFIYVGIPWLPSQGGGRRASHATRTQSTHVMPKMRQRGGRISSSGCMFKSNYEAGPTPTVSAYFLALPFHIRQKCWSMGIDFKRSCQVCSLCHTPKHNRLHPIMKIALCTFCLGGSGIFGGLGDWRLYTCIFLLQIWALYFFSLNGPIRM